jgi:hypothetical protein
MAPSEIINTLHAVIESEVVKLVHCSLSEFITAAILQGQMSTGDHNFVKCHIIYLCATTPSERKRKSDCFNETSGSHAVHYKNLYICRSTW